MAPTTSDPTLSPTMSPTTSDPTNSPTGSPTTSDPTISPTQHPTTSDPTTSPTVSPTTLPTISPTLSNPTISPSTSTPTLGPTIRRGGFGCRCTPNSVFEGGERCRLTTNLCPPEPEFQIEVLGRMMESCSVARPNNWQLPVCSTNSPNSDVLANCHLYPDTAADPFNALMLSLSHALQREYPGLIFACARTESALLINVSHVECDEAVSLLNLAYDEYYVFGTIAGCTATPTTSPTSSPTALPTQIPTTSPTRNPTRLPTREPTFSPTALPTANPTQSPTLSPTVSPTDSPTSTPTSSEPTHTPTESPTTSDPTTAPTTSPTVSPTISPTTEPTDSPTMSPTASPTNSPSMYINRPDSSNIFCEAPQFDGFPSVLVVPQEDCYRQVRNLNAILQQCMSVNVTSSGVGQIECVDVYCSGEVAGCSALRFNLSTVVVPDRFPPVTSLNQFYNLFRNYPTAAMVDYPTYLLDFIHPYELDMNSDGILTANPEECPNVAAGMNAAVNSFFDPTGIFGDCTLPAFQCFRDGSFDFSLLGGPDSSMETQVADLQRLLRNCSEQELSLTYNRPPSTNPSDPWYLKAKGSVNQVEQIPSALLAIVHSYTTASNDLGLGLGRRVEGTIGTLYGDYIAISSADDCGVIKDILNNAVYEYKLGRFMCASTSPTTIPTMSPTLVPTSSDPTLSPTTPPTTMCPDRLVVPCDNCDGLRIPAIESHSSGFADLINFNVAIPDGCFVNDVDVFINLTHTFLGDLHMNLKTPLGTDVEFIDDLCGSADDMRGIIIDDEALTQYGDACPPVSGGRYRSSNGALRTVPSAPSGQWQIVLYDDARVDIGMIHHFELHLGFSSVSASPTQSSASPSISRPTASPTPDICKNIRCANECNTCGLIRHYVEQVWAAVQSGEIQLRFEPATTTTTRIPPRRGRALGRKSENSILSRNTELPNFLRQRRSHGSGSGFGSSSEYDRDRHCRDLELRMQYLQTEGMELHFVSPTGSGSGSGSGIYENRRYDFDHFIDIFLTIFFEQGGNELYLHEVTTCGWNSDVGSCVTGGFTTMREANSGDCETDAPTTSPTATTLSPSEAPTHDPTQSEPTTFPTRFPTMQPTFPEPTEVPTMSPTMLPTTSEPTTADPTLSPTLSPTLMPTERDIQVCLSTEYNDNGTCRTCANLECGDGRKRIGTCGYLRSVQELERDDCNDLDGYSEFCRVALESGYAPDFCSSANDDSDLVQDTCRKSCHTCDGLNSYTCASNDCAEKVENCRYCDGNRCTKCMNYHYLHDGACVRTCPAGKTSFGTGKFSRTCRCVRNNDNCNTCSDENQRCTQCKNRHYLYDGICVPHCPSDYIERGRGNYNRRCVPIIPTTSGPRCRRGRDNCHTCDDANLSCIQCRNQHYLFDGACIDNCPDGFVNRGQGNYNRRCISLIN